jgi:rhomboid protease GluP
MDEFDHRDGSTGNGNLDGEGSGNGSGNGDDVGARPDGLGDDLVVVRRAFDRDRADEWALVLAAVGVPFRIGRGDDGGFAILVSPLDAAAALRALEANDREARAGASVPPAVPDRGTGALGIVFGILLLAFQYVTGLWESRPASRWFAVGIADAERIRAGEWWRAVTAMTLHADLMHVLGNVVASVIFVSAAGRWLGVGVASVLILLAGTGANVLTAVVEKKDHLSVGASTATFAALGLVVGLQSVRRWRGGGHVRRRAWIAAGAGLALLAMLGVSAKSDVFAHAFGLGLGCLLGIGAGILDRPRPEAETRQPSVAASFLQAILALAALGAVVGAWARAFGRI